ncbi:MAG: tRNA (adenosine(37)-N6)-dimethylallyltransferase MiaA, partial [Eggerthellaceae bacterium]|nr:tRNA (adenosine(37)-N6)-dimethylallyltransferase MiaA [Eggerthellaceae bacterium]
HYSPLCMIGLAVAADVLSRRIDARVERMFEQGLEDEVRSLIAGGYRNAITASQAIGYKEVVSYFDGECSRDEAKSAVKHATRQYAKRQRTWFRKDARIGWIDANDERVDSILDAAFSLMRDGLCEVPDVC